MNCAGRARQKPGPTDHMPLRMIRWPILKRQPFTSPELFNPNSEPITGRKLSVPEHKKAGCWGDWLRALNVLLPADLAY